MFLLENFSWEILEIILGHIDVSLCLQDLTEVSPRFNNIISSSSRLMRKVVISWNQERDNLEVPATHRKYQFVEISDIKGCSTQLRKFFEKFAGNFIGMRFLRCTLKAAELHSLLSMVSLRLEDLAVTFMTIEEQEIFPKIEIPKLKYLKIYTLPEGSEIWPLVSMITTNRLVSIWYGEHKAFSFRDASSADTEALIELIKRQKNLKALLVRHAVMRPVIEYWHIQRPFKIELETLFLSFPLENPQFDFSSVWNFVQGQKESLTHLGVKDAYFEGEELQDLLSLKLKSLKLEHCRLKWNESRVTKNSTIETLVIRDWSVYWSSLEAMVHLLSSCEVVTSLEFALEEYIYIQPNEDYIDRIAPVLAAIATKHSITSLTSIYPICLYGTSFPAVKTLSIYTYRDLMHKEKAKKEILALVPANPQLEALIIDIKLQSDADFKTSLQRLTPTTTSLSFEAVYHLFFIETSFPTRMGFGIDAGLRDL